MDSTEVGLHGLMWCNVDEYLGEFWWHRSPMATGAG